MHRLTLAIGSILLLLAGAVWPAAAMTGQDATQVPDTSDKPAPDQATQKPTIEISTAIEEGKKVLLATVTLDDKPVEGAQVGFFVERTFGLLALGTEETLDDGTAAVLFPEGLPGGPTGELQVVAEIKSPEEYASVRAHAKLPGGVVITPKADPFPRAVWAPKAPLPLLATIATLVGGVWCAYAYVFVQLMKIRKGA